VYNTLSISSGHDSLIDMASRRVQACVFLFVLALSGIVFSIYPHATESANETQGQQKVDIMVGFRGLRSVTGGRNPSDGVDSAIQKFGGAVYEHTQVSEAYQYIMQRRAQNPNATIAIVGHSAGANRAIQLTRQLAGQNVRVSALVVADPSAGSAGTVPGNVVQAVGLFSNSGSYAGVNLRGSSPITNVRYPNLDHFGIDNKIEQHMPFVGCAPQCTYSGSAQCAYDPSSGKYNCTPGAAPAPLATQQQPSSFATPTSPQGTAPAGTQSTGSASSPSHSETPTTKGVGVSSGNPKQNNMFAITDTKSNTNDTPSESTDETIAKINCSQTRIRFSCGGRSTKSGAVSKPQDARWRTKGALRGAVTIHPTRKTTYELRCSRNRVVIAKANCTITPAKKVAPTDDEQ
jgi:hypothetical protein